MNNCKALNCNKRAIAKGLCRACYERVRMGGSLDRLNMKRAPNGSGTLTKEGYRRIHKTYGSKMEHILLAEKALGRKLRGKEEVHHMNGKRDDNITPFNLIICPDKFYHRLLHRRTELYRLRHG